jgi:hypothetical protein
MVNNKLLKTGGIYRLIYTSWKSQERPISFIIYSGPFKIHALNINSKKLSILDIKKFAFFIKKMKAIKGVEKYTGRVLYSILKKYFPDIVRKTYRTYTPSHVLGFSLVSTGIISPDLYTEYEKSYFNKFIYEQSKYDIALRTLKKDQIKIFAGAGCKVAYDSAHVFNYDPLFFSPNAISLSNDLQIVCRFNGTAEQIHKTFDFIHATNYFTFKEGLVTNLKAMESLLTKRLSYQGSVYPLTSIIRSKKFVKRGWNIGAGEYLKIMFQISELNLIVRNENGLAVILELFD